MSSTETQEKSITSNLTSQILIAMVLGAILGVVIHNTISAEAALSFSKVKILATVFIRLVQDYRTISFTTLVVGIAKLGNVSAVGRIGERL
jgi:Na+/H+-dicarboxylate symporter